MHESIAEWGKHEIVKWVVQTINSHMNEEMKELSGWPERLIYIMIKWMRK